MRSVLVPIIHFNRRHINLQQLLSTEDEYESSDALHITKV